MIPACRLEAKGMAVPPLPDCRPGASWVQYTTSWKHSLVLLKMGEIIARNMSSWLELLIIIAVALSLLSILFVSMMHSQTNIKCCIEFVVYIICFNDARSNKYPICINDARSNKYPICINDARSNKYQICINDARSNKYQMLHWVCCLYYLFQWCTVKQISNLRVISQNNSREPFFELHNIKLKKENSDIQPRSVRVLQSLPQCGSKRTNFAKHVSSDRCEEVNV
jgi:hypothetical protein